MEDTALFPCRKRRLLNASQNASPSTIWSRGGSAANALRLDLGRRQQYGNVDDEVLGPSPLRNDNAYRLIFDDPPVFALGKEGMSSRTNPLPPRMLLFGRRDVSPPSKWRDSVDSSRGPHLLESASDLAVGSGPRLRSKTGGLRVRSLGWGSFLLHHLPQRRVNSCRCSNQGGRANGRAKASLQPGKERRKPGLSPKERVERKLMPLWKGSPGNLWDH